MTLSNRRGGWTLTELMLVVAILGILFSVGPSLLINIQNFYFMSNARNEIERDVRSSLDMIDRLLRQAVADTITISSPANGGPNSTINFTMIDTRQVSIYQKNNQLKVQISSGAATTTSVLSNNLAYIAFSYPQTLDPSIVSVAITMAKQIQLGRKKVLELTIQKVRIMNCVAVSCQ